MGPLSASNKRNELCQQHYLMDETSHVQGNRKVFYAHNGIACHRFPPLFLRQIIIDIFHAIVPPDLNYTLTLLFLTGCLAQINSTTRRTIQLSSLRKFHSAQPKTFFRCWRHGINGSKFPYGIDVVLSKFGENLVPKGVASFLSGANEVKPHLNRGYASYNIIPAPKI